MQPSAAGTYGMGDSGGSDCHGTRKTHISVGTGCGNLAIPYSALEGLRKLRCPPCVKLFPAFLPGKRGTILCAEEGQRFDGAGDAFVGKTYRCGRVTVQKGGIERELRFIHFLYAAALAVDRPEIHALRAEGVV